MKHIALTLMLAAIAFAGCVDDGADVDSENGGETNGNDNTPVEGQSDDDAEWTALVTAVRTGVEDDFNVEFAYSVDGDVPDALAWALSVEQGAEPVAEGTLAELPGTLVHDYGQDGAYVVNFTTTDGDVTVFANVEIYLAPYEEPCDAVDASSFNANGNQMYLYNAEVWQESNGEEGLQVDPEQTCGTDTRVIPQ